MENMEISQKKISYKNIVDNIVEMDINKLVSEQFVPEWILFLKKSECLNWQTIARHQGISCSLFAYITDFDILSFSSNIGSNKINIHTIESKKYELMEYAWYDFAKYVIIDKVQISNLLYKFFAYKTLFGDDFSYNDLISSFTNNQYGVEEYKTNIINKFKLVAN